MSSRLASGPNSTTGGRAVRQNRIGHQNGITLGSKLPRHLDLRWSNAPGIRQVNYSGPALIVVRPEENPIGISIGRTDYNLFLDHGFSTSQCFFSSEMQYATKSR
jgi:hypothetical protein